VLYCWLVKPAQQLAGLLQSIQPHACAMPDLLTSKHPEQSHSAHCVCASLLVTSAQPCKCISQVLVKYGVNVRKPSKAYITRLRICIANASPKQGQLPEGKWTSDAAPVLSTSQSGAVVLGTRASRLAVVQVRTAVLLMSLNQCCAYSCKLSPNRRVLPQHVVMANV